MPQPTPFLPADTSAAAQATADSARTLVQLTDSLSTQLTQLATDPSSGLGVLESLKTWLLNPSLWMSVLGFFVQATIVVLLALGILRAVNRLAKAYTDRVRDLPPMDPSRQRATTLAALMVSAARYIVWPVAFITILDAAGLSVTSLLATAGFAGLAVGFGAQTLVRDVISGFFLLFDDTLGVGDTVRIGTDEGTVEFIGVRLIKVRKFDGELLMVPSGELRIFGNRSIGFARVLVNVSIPFTTPTAPVLATMRRVADEWANEHRDILLDEAPDVQGITAFGDQSATARIVARVKAGEQFAAERDLRRRLLDAYDAEGFELGIGKMALTVQSGSTVVPPPGPKETPPADDPPKSR